MPLTLNHAAFQRTTSFEYNHWRYSFQYIHVEQLFKMQLRCTTSLYSYTLKDIDHVSQSIYLHKLAVLPFSNVKSLVYLNNTCSGTFCKRGNGLKENDSSIYLWKITIPAIHGGKQLHYCNLQIQHCHVPIWINGVSKAKQMICIVIHIINILITWERGNSYRTWLPQRVADSCHVLQSLIFMILSHMGETHTDGIPVKFIKLFDFDINTWMLQFYT